jgi:hypothetical protein
MLQSQDCPRSSAEFHEASGDEWVKETIHLSPPESGGRATVAIDALHPMMESQHGVHCQRIAATNQNDLFQEVGLPKVAQALDQEGSSRKARGQRSTDAGVVQPAG